MRGGREDEDERYRGGYKVKFLRYITIKTIFDKCQRLGKIKIELDKYEDT